MNPYESLPELQGAANLWKIQFVGSHGTGKSVLATGTESLLQRHNIVPVRRIEELAQQFSDKGVTLNENTSLDAQAAILHSQAAQELLFRERGIHLVTDRSLIDNLGYVLLKFREDDRYTDSGVLDQIETMVLNHLTYSPATHMFFVPLMGGGLVENGTRSVNPEFQVNAHNMIQEIFVETGVPHYRLPVVEPRERGQWLSLIERTLFPDLPDSQYLERAPEQGTLDAYVQLNPGIPVAAKLRSTHDGKEPRLFLPYRTGAEETMEAGVEIRCAETYRLIERIVIER
jgi:hypothetical protein